MGWGAMLTFIATATTYCSTFSCTSTHTSCYAAARSLALPHIRHATLDDLHLHFMLRCMIFTCTSCFATCSIPIDSCWTHMKSYTPKSLSSQSKQKPLRIRSWQWRFTHAEHDNLFQLCGTQVAKL